MQLPAHVQPRAHCWHQGKPRIHHAAWGRCFLKLTLVPKETSLNYLTLLNGTMNIPLSKQGSSDLTSHRMFHCRTGKINTAPLSPAATTHFFMFSYISHFCTQSKTPTYKNLHWGSAKSQLQAGTPHRGEQCCNGAPEAPMPLEGLRGSVRAPAIAVIPAVLSHQFRGQGFCRKGNSELIFVTSC